MTDRLRTGRFPHGLVSLWDIMQILAPELFFTAINHFGQLHQSLEEGRWVGFPDEDHSKIVNLIDSLCLNLSQLGLIGATVSAERVRDIVKNRHVDAGPGFRRFSTIDTNMLKSYTGELIGRLADELKGQVVFVVPVALSRYYTGASCLFGAETFNKFAPAIDDIEGAGKCLALGQGTACVLHLMRVMEVGLKTLAKLLGIPYAPSWESYLNQIAARIGAKHKTKGIKWRKDEPFFRDVSGDLLTVKQAWRNPTMHVVRKYSPDDAEDVFRAVRGFMRRLAAKV